MCWRGENDTSQINVQSALFKNYYTIWITHNEFNKPFQNITLQCQVFHNQPSVTCILLINLIYLCFIHVSYCLKNFSIYCIMHVVYIELNTSVEIPQITGLTKSHSPSSKVHCFPLSQPLYVHVFINRQIISKSVPFNKVKYLKPTSIV